MTYPKTFKKKTPVARAVAVTVVPELPAETRLLEGADEPQGPHTPTLTIKVKVKKLIYIVLTIIRQCLS